MGQLLADRRDIDFVLYEQLETESITKTEKFSDFNKKLFDMVISEARTLAIKEILPTNAEGDRLGVTFENGIVTVPECYHKPYQLLTEGEWTSMTEDPEWGGQGMPNVINQAALEYLWGGNYCLSNYATMGHGTGKMIELFGTDKQKELFLKNLYTGKWGGTMLLTEPEAGSDVGALTTSAVKNADGTYTITGNKIFITNGDHDLTDNIIHPVLARIEGSPQGTKGISIFIVPKIWVNEDGTLGNPNDIVCTGTEEKMGIHSSATCTMGIGGKGQCRGFLLGEENQGMKIMFHMMNEARLNVGFQAFTYASSAYLYAANYAKERIQGKDLVERKSDVTIINHPDVRRMLMWMKSHVEGMRSFIYYVSSLNDVVSIGEDEKSVKKVSGLIELFTPLVKAYTSQRSFDVCVEAMQVYGGYGYTKEYPVEQLARDCKITSIYEGTDGIQAMDLLGRKLGMNKGQLFLDFLNEVQKVIVSAENDIDLADMGKSLQDAVNQLTKVAKDLGQTVATPEVKNAFVSAFPFLDVTGDVIMAWMLLWRATIASEKLKKGPKKKDLNFYKGQIKTAEFFIHTILPGTKGKMDAVAQCHPSALEIAEECFG